MVASLEQLCLQLANFGLQTCLRLQLCDDFLDFLVLVAVCSDERLLLLKRLLDLPLFGVETPEEFPYLSLQLSKLLL